LQGILTVFELVIDAAEFLPRCAGEEVDMGKQAWIAPDGVGGVFTCDAYSKTSPRYDTIREIICEAKAYI
ncbi:hypothetical protein V6S75_33060, partial [Burkholderia pseudomallei]|uniref:hypothetical protein n=1 Tax=Burkholderia pseudomallei TaxID=28450 RepID=UPI003459F1D5